MQKNFMLLEKAVLDKLRELAGVPEGVAASVSTVLDEARNDLAMDAMATEYMSKRKAMEGTEGKILKYMKRRAGKADAATEPLRERLMEAGLTPDGWQELVVRTGGGGGTGTVSTVGNEATPGQGGGAAGSGGGAGDGATAAGTGDSTGSGAGAGAGPGAGAGDGGQGVNLLAGLLGELDGALKAVREAAATRQQSQELVDMVNRIGEQVNAQVAEAERTIEAFAEKAKRIGSASQEAKAAEPGMSRAELLGFLAELVQELRQPLSVIICALDMVLGKRLGELVSDQELMLTMASTSSQRLNHLVDKLQEISGMPPERVPDRKILAALYDEKGVAS
jgi:hypothetical protein